MSTTTKESGPAMHYSSTGEMTVQGAFRMFCGKRGGRRDGSGLAIRAGFATNDRAAVTCRKCLAKLARDAAKAAAAPRPAKVAKLRACDWCDGDGRYGSRGRFCADGEIRGAGESCDFCARCKGAGKVVR